MNIEHTTFVDRKDVADGNQFVFSTDDHRNPLMSRTPILKNVATINRNIEIHGKYQKVLHSKQKILSHN